MSSTQIIMTEFTNVIDVEKEYTRGEMGKILTQIYYNIFVKEQMPLIKEEFPELSRQDLMRKVGELWKMKKGSEEEEK